MGSLVDARLTVDTESNRRIVTGSITLLPKVYSWSPDGELPLVNAAIIAGGMTPNLGTALGGGGFHVDFKGTPNACFFLIRNTTSV